MELDAAKSKLCGITTDGESANTGVAGGLWTKLQAETDLNLLTFWCACHRSSLAFKSMMRDTHEVQHLLSDIVSVSTFYRVSGTCVSYKSVLTTLMQNMKFITGQNTFVL